MPNIIANWKAPKNIGALTTTRQIGVSRSPYARNNIAYHVGDDETSVLQNRDVLRTSLKLPGEPVWLDQIHSNQCIVVENDTNRTADAAVTRLPLNPLVVMTADCLPIVLCDNQGSEIAAIHAGWRGLINGIIENTLHKMKNSSSSLIAWLGPTICQNCFEVGPEVLDAYVTQYPFTRSTFRPKGEKVLADLAKMAELILKENGVINVYHSAACTFELKDSFYSYRRDGQTGRMATLIWFTG